MQLVAKLSLQSVESRLGLGLTDLHPLVWGHSSRRLFDSVEFNNPPDGLVGDGRALGLVDVDELAPDMGEAGDLACLAGAI